MTATAEPVFPCAASDDLSCRLLRPGRLGDGAAPGARAKRPSGP